MSQVLQLKLVHKLVYPVVIFMAYQAYLVNIRVRSRGYLLLSFYPPLTWEME